MLLLRLQRVWLNPPVTLALRRSAEGTGPRAHAPQRKALHFETDANLAALR